MSSSIVAEPAIIPRRVAELVADAIRTSVIEGTHAPGEHLVEARLQRDLGVSRNALRDALEILANEGLVHMQMHRGAFVATTSRTDIEEVYALRLLLERAAILDTARHRYEIDELRLHARRAIALAEAQDWHAAGTENMRFHLAVGGLGENRRAARALATLLAESRLQLAALGTPREQHEEYLPQNIAIVDRLAEGDAPAAAAGLESYLGSVRERLLAHYSGA